MDRLSDSDQESADSKPRDGADTIAQPIDGSETPPRLPFAVVGIGASAGGLEAYTEFIQTLPPHTGMAYVLVQHLSPKHESLVAEILGRHTVLPVIQIEDGMTVQPDHVYVIRPGYTLTIKNGVLHLGESLSLPGHNRPIDDFFRSLAEEQRERAVAIILSGMGSNGTAGAQAVRVVGGLCIAQDPESAKFPSMPRSMMDAGAADFVLRPHEIHDVLKRYVSHPYARGEHAAENLARREQVVFNEILSVLRTRTRHDFSGYKKPTLIRRIQRRMGLSQVEQLTDYARILRQSPAEVSALADDLLIHVTGFFRDAVVWDMLRDRIIRPLVADRAEGGSIRVWVTACATGEEAYTLAILLAEEAEKIGKRFDIKIFATDMAERSLGHARGGIFPGGIESEISPDRLARFFDKDDAMYRVKKELRELVIFAPQNVLQDPPFSRLDIVTCRNLLIYLEPEVQRRVLSLLHFGLREGGTLVLGNSETVGDSDDLFESVDKKLRIYRRVGPTRHGTIEFPPPRSLTPGGDTARTESRVARTSVAQITQKLLLEHYTPAAVVVDRQGRIVYFHGNTSRYLDQPSGEPTRDLLTLARDSIRTPLRDGLQKAIAENQSAYVRDGHMPAADGQRRVEIIISPLEQRPGMAFFLICFSDRAEVAPLPVSIDGDPEAMDARLQSELRRIRDELQSTIEELQTSNEEMKASNEEVSSVNEELQSTNEELETSKEELQSLNEELSTVNAQLTSKMEELERITNDLQSLLSSTDIAVIFLDAQQRIRRFTPAVRHLIDLIPSDIGRPLRDLAHKFTDPDLMADAASVLAKLIPIEREITADGGRWYSRKVLPYRTVDNRIEGVVVTFVDVTERRGAEVALRKSEERHRALVSKATVGICETDTEGRITFCNDCFSEMVGRRAEDLNAGLSLQDITHPDDLAETHAMLAKLQADGHPFEIEKRYVRPNGEVLWVNNFVNSVHDASGRVSGAVAVSVDITARRAAQAALRDSETRFRAVADAGPDLLWESSRDGATVWVNERYLDYTGRAAAQLHGYGWLEAVHPDDRMATRIAIQNAVETGAPLRHEHRLRAGDGTYRWFLTQGRALRNGDGQVTHWFGATTDIHEQRLSLEALRESEERFRLAIEAAHMGFWDWNVIADTVKWDPVYNRMLGLPPDQATGTSADLLMCVHPDERDRVAATLRGSLERRSDYDIEFRVKHRDGSVRWIAGYGRPFADAKGNAYRMIGGVLDITERKLVEQERASLLQSEQAARAVAEAANNTKDQFLANASHELRTPLSAILLWSSLLQGDSADASMHAEGLAAIEHSAKSQQKLIEDLMDSARISAGKVRLDLKPTDLAARVMAAVDTVRPTAESKGVELHTDVGDDIGQALADADRLEQIVWNLVSNGVKFTPTGGRVDVRLRRKGRQVEIRVSDTGQGIEPDMLPEIFARFRQVDPSNTRRHGGLGLGLAISRQLAELHGGTIDVISDGKNKGSTFTALLPLPKRTPDTAELKQASGIIPGGSLTGVRVLLVEDDAKTRDGLARVLTKAGAAVEPVGHVDEAIAAIVRKRPDAIVSDIGLPDRDGHAFLRQLRSDNELNSPRLPAVALSAFDRPQDRARAIESGFDEYLTKPVQPPQLVWLVRKLLGME